MKNKEEILNYLKRYTSETSPKSISEIAETLSIDSETVGLVIHELMKTHIIGKAYSHDLNGMLYYLASNHTLPS